MTENKLIAEVNGKKIYQSDVYDLMQGMQDSERFNSAEGFNILADEVVNQELLLADAKEKKMDEEEEFVKELDLVRDNMLKNYAMHKILDQAEVSDDELKSYYEENKETLFSPVTYTASHILVEEEKKANDILDEIKNGLEFEEAAKKYSIDPSGKNGGSLGTFPKGVMVKEFQEGLDSIDEGEISDVIKSQFGYHIIKLDNKQEHQASFDEMKEQVKNTYQMIKRQENYLKVVNELAKKAEVKKYY